MNRCSYHLNPKNADGTYTAVCLTHHGFTWEYGDPRVIMEHKCPLALALIDAVKPPPDYTEFYRNQAKIKYIDGKLVWIEGGSNVVRLCQGNERS